MLTIYFIFRGSKLRALFIEVTKQFVLEIYLHKLLLFDPIRKYVYQKSSTDLYKQVEAIRPLKWGISRYVLIRKTLNINVCPLPFIHEWINYQYPLKNCSRISSLPYLKPLAIHTYHAMFLFLKILSFNKYDNIGLYFN